jgi:hypothetical protein
MHMQRLTSAYRASLILAAENPDTSHAPAEAHQSGDRGPGRRIGYRDLEDFDSELREAAYRYLSDLEDEDQPTYWYWSYDHPDAGI